MNRDRQTKILFSELDEAYKEPPTKLDFSNGAIKRASVRSKIKQNNEKKIALYKASFC